MLVFCLHNYYSLENGEAETDGKQKCLYLWKNYTTKLFGFIIFQRSTFYGVSNYFIFILVSSVRAGLIFELITTNENFRSEGFSIERFKVPMEEERSFKRRGGNRITSFQNLIWHLWSWDLAISFTSVAQNFNLR